MMGTMLPGEPKCGKMGHPVFDHDCKVADRTKRLYELDEYHGKLEPNEANTDVLAHRLASRLSEVVWSGASQDSLYNIAREVLIAELSQRRLWKVEDYDHGAHLVIAGSADEALGKARANIRLTDIYNQGWDLRDDATAEEVPYGDSVSLEAGRSSVTVIP